MSLREPREVGLERSALSGEEIPEGSEARVTVSFEDGISRDVVVSAEEAADLRSKGRDVSPWYAHVGRRIARPGAWVLGVALTSLLIPAITKQWADRPEELELRISLIDQIGESAARTINTARFIVSDNLPKARLREVVCARDQDSIACQEKMDEESEQEQDRQISAKNEWLEKGAVVESQLAAYFPGTELSREGKAYINAVRIYLFLAGDVCGEKRDEGTQKLLRYFGENPDDAKWAALDLTPEECEQKSANLDFRGIYGPMGDRLLNSRLELLTLLNQSDAEGFSVGLADFVTDALPALVLLAAAAIYLIVYAWSVRRRLSRRA
jgi:hypothetical protein